MLADFVMIDALTITRTVNAAIRQPEFNCSTDLHFYLRDFVRTTRFFGTVAVDVLPLPASIGEPVDEVPVSRVRVTSPALDAALLDL
ncbi:MAG: hypothetical protein AAGG11_09995 [Pseudomonadota bacterium]